MKQNSEAKTEMQKAKGIPAKQREELLSALKARFEKNMNRHKGLEWAKVQAKLEANTEKLWSLNEMERTGGEPDVVGHDKKTSEYIFYDCSAESPDGRRSNKIMTNIPHIRFASRDDALAVKLISDENDLSGNDTGFALEPMDENHTWIVLEDATAKITGAAYFGPESHSDRVWNLYFLAVAKQCQGMGVGAALVTYVELNLRNRGEDIANLLLIETSSAESFEKTRGFYRRQGYVEEARIRDYYGPNDDKIVFWKRLHKTEVR